MSAVQPGEGSRVERDRGLYARDPSLRLKKGYGQDDALRMELLGPQLHRARISDKFAPARRNGYSSRVLFSLSPIKDFTS